MLHIEGEGGGGGGGKRGPCHDLQIFCDDVQYITPDNCMLQKSEN